MSLFVASPLVKSTMLSNLSDILLANFLYGDTQRRDFRPLEDVFVEVSQKEDLK
jgi:hypothetical protein